MKEGIFWELLGVSRRVGFPSASPNTWAATHRQNVSPSQFPLCVRPLHEIRALLRKSLLSPRSLWDSSLPPWSPFVVECHQCSNDHMLVCDQKTFLTHSVGLQINSDPERPRRKLSLEKNLDFSNSGGGALLFDLWAAQESNPRRSLWGQLLAGWLASFKHIGPVSMLAHPGTVSRKAGHKQSPLSHSACSPLSTEMENMKCSCKTSTTYKGP